MAVEAGVANTRAVMAVAKALLLERTPPGNPVRPVKSPMSAILPGAAGPLAVVDGCKRGRTPRSADVDEGGLSIPLLQGYRQGTPWNTNALEHLE